MRREVINRDKVEWERASCRGLDTDLFYTARTDLLAEGLNYNHLRRMCLACPIQVECLKVGTSYEPYGFWGGLSEDERRHIYAGKLDTRVIGWLRRDLAQIGVRISSLVQTVLSVERDFTFNK
jgi:WhiB family redox-sensing transcriptional regulator